MLNSVGQESPWLNWIFNTMLVFSEHMGPRLRYIAGFVLGDLLGMNPRFTTDREEASSLTGPVISYSDHPVDGSFIIQPSGFLGEQGIRPFIPEVGKGDGGIFLFPTDIGDLPFDLFSAAFYLISRYEEYLPFRADAHGRFPSTESLAYRHGFLEIPVVNRWANDLADRLKQKMPNVKASRPPAVFLPTIDIDVAWLVKNKGFYRTAGGLAKTALHGDLQGVSDRVAVLGGRKTDPNDSYGFIRENHGENLTVFMHAGPGGKFDLNNPVSNPEWKKLVAEMDSRFTVGFHPSYHSGENPAMFAKERKIIESITGRRLTRVRQHFLRLTFPSTLRRMAEAGFTEDYTMGYADHTGFRAGTSSPFLFYDLVLDSVSPLKIFPFAVMDRTLKDYLSLGPGQALEKIRDLATTVRREGGIFIPVWHNDSLGDSGEWSGWRKVYSSMLSWINETY